MTKGINSTGFGLFCVIASYLLQDDDEEICP
jgi:hypothetical protein